MLELKAVDFQVLPLGLLPAVKQHVRVEFDRDDGYLVEATARAIAEIESVTDLSVNPAIWLWEPSPCDRGWGKHHYRVPKTPVRQVDTLDAAGTVTGTVSLVFNGMAGYLPESVTHIGTYQIHCGYLTVPDIAPAVLNPILMLTGTLYEQREAVQMGSFNELPDMANRLMAGLWRPSC